MSLLSQEQRAKLRKGAVHSGNTHGITEILLHRKGAITTIDDSVTLPLGMLNLDLQDLVLRENPNTDTVHFVKGATVDYIYVFTPDGTYSRITLVN